MRRTLYVIGPEVLPYGEALTAQQRLLERCIETERRDNFLMLLEHPPVITVGRSGDVDEVTADAEALCRRGVQVVETNRGGRVTFHGPGQLVMYPVMDLKAVGADLHAYLRDLEGWLIALLDGFGIAAEPRPPHTGVWVGEAKIASIGIAVRRWVAYHGVALNVATDLSFFDLIVPCGLTGVRLTSMAELLGRSMDVAEAASRAAATFAQQFAFDECVPCGREEAVAAR